MSTEKAEEALQKWKDAVNLWRETESSPGMCHPWNTLDFEGRLKTFGNHAKIAGRSAVNLAASGFEFETDGKVVCKLCHVQFSVDTDDNIEHDAHCPWKGRPYATLKSAGASQGQPAGTIFDNTRHALEMLERIYDNMASIKRRG